MKKVNSKQYIVISKILAFFLLSSTIYYLLSTTAYAQDFKLIVCDGVTVPCTFEKLIELVQNIISAMIIISTFFATAAFAYAGFLLLTSGGNESNKTKAKEMLGKVLKGYLWILVAWVLVYTITTVLLRPGLSLLGQPQ